MDCADSDRYEPNFTDSVTSTSSLLLPIAPDPKPYEERRRLRIGSWELSLLWSNVLFAFLATAGQFGEDATLPLWLHSTNNSNSSARTVDGYFVLSFSSLSFMLIFGVALLLIRVLWPRDIGDTERRFSHRLLFLVGLCNALSAVLTVFASNSLRTPLYLQTILGISMIPSTILFRRLILKKKPTLKKLLCAAIVTVAPVFCLIPTFVPNLDSKHATQQSEADGVSKVLWPLIFTISYVLTAIMNVLEEKGLKIQNEMSRRGVNLVYFLFWTSVYQFLCVAALFWVDILPWYGNTNHGMDDFGTNWWFGIQCFFGAAGCDATSGTRGTMFILMYVLTYVGGANLLRHAEGATWLAIVTSLTTPLGFIFWSLFSEVPFKWQSDDHVTTAAVAIGAIFIMFPAVIIYNMGAPEISLNDDNSRREASQHS